MHTLKETFGRFFCCGARLQKETTITDFQTKVSIIKHLEEFEVRKKKCQTLIYELSDKLPDLCGTERLPSEYEDTWKNIQELKSEISDINSSIATLLAELACFDSKST